MLAESAVCEDGGAAAWDGVGELRGGLGRHFLCVGFVRSFGGIVFVWVWVDGCESWEGVREVEDGGLCCGGRAVRLLGGVVCRIW